MKVRLLGDALLILCFISADAFGQTGNVPLRAKPTSSGQGREEVADQVPGRSSRPQPVERTTQDVDKSHPDSIQVQLGLLADSLSEAGLTEESRQLQALQRRIGDEHYERLSIAHKRAQARVPQIKLHVQWVEFVNSSAITPLWPLMEPALQANPSSKDSPAPKPNGSGKPIARVSAFIDELVKRKLGTVVTDPPITLLSGETTEFEQGQEMDLLLKDEGSNLVLTFTKADSPTVADSGRNTRWVGTSVKTTVTVAKDNMINFSVAIDHADIGFSPFPRRIETEAEISEGHSLVVAGVPTYQSVTEVMRLPTDGFSLDVDIPIKKRFFPFKTGRQEKQQDLSVVSPAAVRKKQVMVVITPEIIRPLEAHKPVSIPAIPAVRTRGVAQLASSWVRSTRNPITNAEQE